MTKFNLPLTYQPKIRAVIDMKCTQTIRVGRKFKVGDLVSFHGWEGKPYRSKWSFRTPYFRLCEVIDISILPDGIGLGETVYPWCKLSGLATLDHIYPPTGEQLGITLRELDNLDDKIVDAQIIRWDEYLYLRV